MKSTANDRPDEVQTKRRSAPMTSLASRRAAFIALTLSGVLTACGGGGGVAANGPPANGPQPPVTPTTPTPTPNTSTLRVTATLQPNVLDLRTTPSLLTGVVGQVVKLTSLPSGFAVGTVFVTTDKAFKAETVTPSATGYSVTTVLPVLEEVFRELEIEGDLDFSTASFVNANPTAAQTGRERALKWQLPQCTIDRSKFSTAEGGEASCSIAYQAESGAIDMTVTGTLGIRKFKTIPVQYSLTGGTSTLGMSAELVLSADVLFSTPDVSLKEVEYELGAIEVAVPGTFGLVSAGVPLWFVIEPKLTAGLKVGTEYVVPVQTKAVRTPTSGLVVTGMVDEMVKTFKTETDVLANAGSSSTPISVGAKLELFVGTKTGLYLRTIKSIISAGAYAKAGYDVQATVEYDLARATADNQFGACVDATAAMSVFGGGEAQFRGAKLFSSGKWQDRVNFGSREEATSARAEVKLLTSALDTYTYGGGCNPVTVAQVCPVGPLALQAIVGTGILPDGTETVAQTTAEFDLPRYLATARSSPGGNLASIGDADPRSFDLRMSYSGSSPLGPVLVLGQQPTFGGRARFTQQSARYLSSVMKACASVDRQWEKVPGREAVDACDTYSYVTTVPGGNNGATPSSELAQYRREETLAALKHEVIANGLLTARNRLDAALGDFSGIGIGPTPGLVLTSLFTSLEAQGSTSPYRSTLAIPLIRDGMAPSDLTTQQKLAIGAYRRNLTCLRGAVVAMRAAKKAACGGQCFDDDALNGF